jgi:aspartate/methionine/tyrosine aminotransferase
MVAVFEKRRNLIVKELERVKKINVFRPQGSFYVFCDVSPTGLTSMEVTTRLLEEARVAVIPGEPFGCPTHVRLSFATSDQAITEGISRIRAWVEKL